MGKMQRRGGLISLFSCAATRPRELVGESPAFPPGCSIPISFTGIGWFPERFLPNC